MHEDSQFYKTNSNDETAAQVFVSTILFAIIFITIYVSIWFLLGGSK